MMIFLYYFLFYVGSDCPGENNVKKAAFNFLCGKNTKLFSETQIFKIEVKKIVRIFFTDYFF
jgi:hypothetical protein